MPTGELLAEHPLRFAPGRRSQPLTDLVPKGQALNEELRRRYVRDLITDLEQVGGARLEQWIKPLWDHLAGSRVDARGINPQGAPVPGSLDSLWPDGSAAEASSDANYFAGGYQKPVHDFKHVVQFAPAIRIVRLFTTQVAPPKAIRTAQRVKSRLERIGYRLDLWDGRRIAEYIVDNLLLDDRFVTRVGDALPNLHRISEQNAASARVPALDPLYGGREDEEAEVRDRLRRRKYVVLFGLAGIGKTELACSIADNLRDDFELVIWLDADRDRLQGIESLRSFDVRSNGYKLNILNLLASHNTLLILDNIGVDLDLDALAATCSDSSRIIVTSQVEFGIEPIRVGFVGRLRSREILSAGVAQPCPDEVLDAVLESVDGHPLVLRMLNQLARENRDWERIARQCAHIAGAPDERRQTVASRILEGHLDIVGPELALFAWCGSASIDHGFFEYYFGTPGIRKLQRWTLTARGQSDAIRLHALVYACVERLRDRLPIDSESLEQKLEGYISNQIAPKRLGFFRVVNRHRDLIERLLIREPRAGALRYGYLHGHRPRDLRPELIGDPTADLVAGPDNDRKTWLLSVVEAIEADYRRTRDLRDKDTAKTTLETRLATLDDLAADPRLSEELRSIARHHKAKSLLKLGRVQEALTAFEALVGDAVIGFASQLQVARLIESDPQRGRNLIFEIIAAERDHPGKVAMSILLETLSTLRRRHLRRFVPEMTEAYGPFMAQQIKAAACSGEDQPIRAFSSVGPEWAYKAPELFAEVVEAIDLGTPAEAEDDDERVAIGRILVAEGKMLLRERQNVAARDRFLRAETFFAALTRQTAFSRTHYADALLRLDRPQDAANALDPVPMEKREEYWRLRRSEAHLLSNELDQALARINETIESPRLGDRKPTFLAHRSDVLFAMGDPTHERDLREAIAMCIDPQYQADLELRLATRAQA